MKDLRQYVRKILSENLLGEEYPTSFNMEFFKGLKSFAQRIQYCEQLLQRISSGSSRIVYKIDEHKVLKLAKNSKGIAQNEVEINYSKYPDISSVIAQVFDSEENYLWVEMELARKVSVGDFKRITGYSFKDYCTAIHNYGNDVHGTRNSYKMDIDKAIVDSMWEDEFVYKIFDFIGNYQLPIGDLMRLSSYGIVHRGGSDAIVLIDFGLTQDVQSTHYSSKKMAYENFKSFLKNTLKETFETNINDNFWKWFSGSKVIDSKGNPLPVHHGTSKKFSSFNIKKSAQPVIWFASNKGAIESGDVGAAGSGHIMDLYVSLKNPAGWKEYEQYGLGQLHSMGYDGAILPDPDGTFTGFVFEPSQLKSVANKGEWDTSNKNIFKEDEGRQLGKSLATQMNTPYVTIYRAAPMTANEFFDKDYITLSKKFAIEHAENNHVYHDEPYHVIQALVSTKNVYDAYNPGEYFYSGPNKKAKEIYISKGPDEYEGWEDNLNEVENNIWVQGGIILIKGEKLEDGTQKLFATHIDNLNQHGRTKVDNTPGQAAKMVTLTGELYRLVLEEGKLKTYRVDWSNEKSLTKTLKFYGQRYHVVLNNNKTPLHWETLKYRYMPDVVNHLGFTILETPNIKWSLK
jgi:hypothetical protein